jgi:hypothetical protein
MASCRTLAAKGPLGGAGCGAADVAGRLVGQLGEGEISLHGGFTVLWRGRGGQANRLTHH